MGEVPPPPPESSFSSLSTQFNRSYYRAYFITKITTKGSKKWSLVVITGGRRSDLRLLTPQFPYKTAIKLQFKKGSQCTRGKGKGMGGEERAQKTKSRKRLGFNSRTSFIYFLHVGRNSHYAWTKRFESLLIGF